MADLMTKNREYFDKMSSTYEGDFAESLARLELVIKEHRGWLGVNWVDRNSGPDHVVKVLDYACGPGTVSRALLDLATKFLGLDVSDGMIAQYNKFASDSGISPEKMFAQQGDLLADTLPESLSGPEFFNFDFVGVSLAMHHFADPELAMKRLAARMKKGGVCLIIDLIPGQDEHFHEHNSEAKHVVYRTGFEKEEMREIFASAGLNKGFDYQVQDKPFSITVNGKQRDMVYFMAKAELA